MTWIKQPTHLNFTIQTLELGESFDDPFQIEWKRGDSTGMTERVYPNTDKQVIFSKSFRTKTTMYIKKKNNTVRPKFLNLTVCRYLDGTNRKVFGKMDLDVTSYYNKSQSQAVRVEVESLHSKKSYLNMSVTANPIDKHKAKVQETDNLDSVSEAIQLTTDKQDEWDVSETITAEGRQKINSFFMQRQADKEQAHAMLDSFLMAPNTRRTHTNSTKQNPTASADFLVGSTTTSPNSFLSKPPKVHKHHHVERTTSAVLVKRSPPVAGSTPTFQLNAPKESDTETDNEPATDTEITLSEYVGKPEENEENEEPNESEPVQESHHAPIPVPPKKEPIPEVPAPAPKPVQPSVNPKNLLRSVLNKHWCIAPIMPDVFPKASAAIYAAILYSKILEPNVVDQATFDTVKTDFVHRYKISVIIERGLEIDKFIVTLYLLSLLSKTTDADQNRLHAFMDALIDVCKYQLECVIDKLYQPFTNAGLQMIAGVIENDMGLAQISSSYLQISNGLMTTEYIKSFLMERTVIAFDGFLVRTLASSATACTFGNAAIWGSLMTMLSDDLKVEFKLFREALSVLTMAMGICAQPEDREAFWPNLPPSVVCQLIVNQKPDDMMPIQNDPTAFIKYYELDVNDLKIEVDTDYKGDFSELICNVDTSHWQDITFDEDTMTGFSYLQNYFKTSP